jgi:hypothetical protein
MAGSYDKKSTALFSISFHYRGKLTLAGRQEMAS